MTDLERVQAQEWRGGSEGQALPARRLQLIEYDMRLDNAGRSAWRRGDTAFGFIKLERDFYPDVQKQVSISRGGSALGTSFPELDDIATKTNTEIRFASYRISDGLKLEIWAEKDEDVAEAKTLIRRWQRENTGKKASWGKIDSLTPAQRARRDEELRERDERQQYIKYPPENMTFAAIGSFKWPDNLEAPQKIFGGNCESLDPIRMDNRCYILLDASKLVFRVFSQDQARVLNALTKLRTTAFQVMAQSHQTNAMYLVKPMIITSDDTVVDMIPYKPVRGSLMGTILRLADDPKPSVNSIRSTATSRNAAMSNKVKDTLVDLLSSLRYQRGPMELRVSFGTFLLTQHWKDPQLSYRDFRQMMSNPSVAGRLIVSDDLGKKFDTRLKRASTIGMAGPLKTIHLRKERPTYAGFWIIEDIQNKQYYGVELQYEIGPGNQVGEPVKKRLFRVGDEAGRVDELIDLTLINLETKLENATGWQLGLKSAMSVPPDESTHEKLRGFTDSLKPHLPESRRPPASDGVWFPFKLDPRKGMRVHSAQQRKIWRFDLEPSPYSCELMETRHVNAASAVDSLPWWSFSITSQDWRQKLDENEKLKIGEVVDWEASLEKWFPEQSKESAGRGSSSGYDEFLKMLEQLEELLTSR